MNSINLWELNAEHVKKRIQDIFYKHKNMTLQELIKWCKCGVYLTVNRHKDMYESAEESVRKINEMDYANNGHHPDYQPEIDKELVERMAKEDSIFELQFYPDTPIGSYSVYGTTLEEVLKKAQEIYEERN